MCCHNNSGWFTLLIALIIVFFILNRFDDRDYGYEDREGCERDRDRSGDYGNRSGCGCLSGGYNR